MELLEKIRKHPIVAEGEYAVSIKEGRRKLVYCSRCPVLVAWDGLYSDQCMRCGTTLQEISKMTPEQATKILADLDENQKEKDDREAINRRYAFPPENKDHTYTCVSCKKTSVLDHGREIHSPRRLSCSNRCDLAFLGKEVPEGRKWAGFVTLTPSFKGSTVHYLGVTKMHGKTVECYVWSEGSGGGTLYAYHGDGEYDYYCIQARFGRQHMNDWAEIFKLWEEKKGIDESWRVGANVKEGWTL